MQKRPISELLEALEELGTEFKWLGSRYHFPVKIIGIRNPYNRNNIDAIRQDIIVPDRNIELNADRSSQFLSALLMTAPVLLNSLTIQLTGKKDVMPYVRITEQMMKQFGYAGVERYGKNCYKVFEGSYNIEEYQVEPDVSAACYFYAMAAVTGGTAVVRHIRKDSLQGDMEFIDVLEEMGCRKEWDSNGELKLYAPEDRKLKGIDINMAGFSDQALTLAAIAPFAEPARIKTYNDHRAAMAFTITGMAAGGIEIEDPLCCNKTFEGYFDIVDSLY